MIVNVRYESGFTIVTAWVQCVGRSNECKLFLYNLQMRIGNDIAHYEDYVSCPFNLFLSIQRSSAKVSDKSNVPGCMYKIANSTNSVLCEPRQVLVDVLLGNQVPGLV